MVYYNRNHINLNLKILKRLRERRVSKYILNVFKILASNQELIKYYKNNEVSIRTSDKKELLRISPTGIESSFGNTFKQVFSSPSPLRDTFIDKNLLSAFIRELSSQEALLRLNHIGFCYRSASKKRERERIRKETTKNNWNLYTIESNDDSLWLFVGNISNWKDPVAELSPVEKTDDYYVNYWLPNFQIDIDTNLSEGEIENSVHNSFKGARRVIRSVIIDGIVYNTRVWLGIVSGVNICLDLATKSRNAEFTRKNVMKKIA